LALGGVLVPASALAQGDPKTGVVMSSAGSVAVIWHASDRVAVRPEIAFSVGSETITPDLGITVAPETSTQHSVSVGASVLFYTARWDNVRLYVAPRYFFNHSSFSSSSPIASDASQSAHSVSGSLGAEFAAHRHFALFGEVGLTYSHSSSDESHAHTFGQRAAAGAILYF
jgi:hypothetical protein